MLVTIPDSDTSRTCPDGIAACCNGPIARGPLLLPKLIFHGCLIAFLLVVLVLTNVYFCQELALLINVVVPVIIVFYTCHSVQVWRMRNFKKEIIKGEYTRVSTSEPDKAALDEDGVVCPYFSIGESDEDTN